MSSAANHRKRSHRSEAMHRQASTKHYIYAINKMNERVSFIDRGIANLKKAFDFLKNRKERTASERGD